MIALMMAAALLQTADPCHAVPQGMTHRSCPPWRSAYRNARLEVFVNPASVARGDSTFEISLRIVYAADQAEGLRSAVSRYRYDCARRTGVMLRITGYDAAGVMIEDRAASGDETEPQSAPPRSPSEALLDEFCPR